MLAIYLMAVFGFLTAIMAGVAYTGAETSLQLIERRVEETQNFFTTASLILNEQVTAKNMELTGVSTCKGNAVTAQSPLSLLCRDDVLQLSTWGMLGTVTDPWASQIQGVVVTERKGVGPAVLAPVTAYSFISPGPDRQLSPNLSAQLAQVQAQAAGGSASVRDVMRLEADQGSDDIVMNFNNQAAQMSRWDRIEGAISIIAAAAQEKYMVDFQNFEPQLLAYHQSLLTAGYSMDSILTTESLAKGWKTRGYATEPKLINPVTSPLVLGVDGDVSIIESARPLGSSLNLTSTVYSANPGLFPSAKDALTIGLSNNGSPWGDTSGNIGYTKSFIMN
ncbi:MAG: hypothetical protein COY40_04115 [Alphaproteobacteria bacterium CG_4_10_14_0_8_um_filter_53_9]|nr:MAG: hypothetical protein COY40_04115 [Alphaproteobacteria bacterium CG_4_10_14_0_8_um_filter_53_9]